LSETHGVYREDRLGDEIPVLILQSFSYSSYPSVHRRNYGIQDSSYKALVP